MKKADDKLHGSGDLKITQKLHVPSVGLSISLQKLFVFFKCNMTQDPGSAGFIIPTISVPAYIAVLII